MISTAEIASLRDFASTDRHPIVSLYLNVDGARFPTRADFETEFSILVNNTRKAARAEMQLNRDQETWLDSELQAIGEFLALKFKRNGTRSLVIFSCQPEGLWQVNELKVPVDNKLYVDWKPQVAPLVETLSGFQQVCVLVTSKESARVFSVFAGEIIEQTQIFDSVLKHHEQGGWEQNKLQRRHEKQVRGHLKNAAAITLDYFKQQKFDRLAVGIADELWPELDKVLHPYLKEKMLGRFPVDVSAPADEIMRKVETLEQQERADEESMLLQSLGPELEAGRTYVGGLDDVLAMLNQRRVDLLLVESGYTEAGRKCYSCNTLEFSEHACPTCGRTVEGIADVVDEAKELAIRQDARVLTVPAGHPAMARAGKIAARLRY
jgi:peptide subunit release factor 1 (eRF1)